MQTDQPIRAKKSLGQNFLKDQKTLDTIVGAVIQGMPVLEIGPGKGALTKRLLRAGHTVLAIEKDHRLIEPLQELFANEIALGQLKLIEGDALVDTPDQLGLKTGEFQVVANLPYYITGLYLRETFESQVQPHQIILLLQQEVVDRIVAADGRESILSISVKLYGTVRKLCNVKRKHFSPAPKVDSAVLQVTDISKTRLEQSGIIEEQLFSVVKAGFANKRKTLVNNLKQYPGVQKVLKKLDLDEKIRPEKLTLDQWLQLIQSISCSTHDTR